MTLTDHDLSDLLAALKAGEMTDKGSINQRAVLTYRADTAAALHDGTLASIITPRPTN